jgi:sigma-E factor negative regulatory protein RseA
MNQSLEERLSALLDGELSALEQRSVVSIAVKDPEARATLNRYQRVGELMRGETGRAVRPDFAAAVSAALDKEPTILAPRGVSRRRWVRRAYGLGLAASVAALAVTMGPRLLQIQEPALAQVAAVSQPNLEALAAAQPLSPPPAESALKPDMERKLNRYLVNHGEYAAASSMNRVLPYAAFVSYDKGR